MKNKNIIIISLIVMISLAGCLNVSANNESDINEEKRVSESNNSAFGLELVWEDEESNAEYYRDKTTDTLFIFKMYYGKNGSFEEISDPETGLPLTYTRYLEIYNDSNNSNELKK